MKSAIISLLTCLFLLTLVLPQSHAQGAKSKAVGFCEDGGPKTYPLDANSLPKAVVDAVMNAPQSKQELSYADEKASELTPEKLLHAARIRLSSDRVTTYMILSDPPLSGADNSWFWIVQKNGTKATVLLMTGGSCVELESSETHGYRDVMSYWASASTEVIDTFQYGGKDYKLAHEKTKPFRPNE